LKRKTIILDLDDTLINTSHLYWSVKDEILTSISEEIDVDKKILDKEFEVIEHDNMIIYGYHPSRYGISANNLCEKYEIQETQKILSLATRIILPQ